ncbi:MAG: phenylalanine--tRNA ligase subunit beta, partial [Chitinophagaceae bacterium]|nr:phenylalanine--tRNA ligase subunit beta [Chitinophagaceae bacterium]
PDPLEKTQVGIKYHYLKKLSGKNYHPDAIKKILTSLGFEIIKEGIDELWVAVPFSKPDIGLPADIVEEILRVDGLDNVEITGAVTFSPSVDENGLKETLKEKISQYLVGRGFSEIVTNSITNSKYFTEQVLSGTVKMINNLSIELDVLRPSMLETGLEAIAYNVNRKNSSLLFFELGKTYHLQGLNKYAEQEHLCLYVTGKEIDPWKRKANQFDFYFAKGIATAVLALCGVENVELKSSTINPFSLLLQGFENNHPFIQVAEVNKKHLEDFGIKQPVFFIDIDWGMLVTMVTAQKILYKEVARFPTVQRDLAVIVDKHITYDQLTRAVKKTQLQKLTNVQLFDVFESEKLGTGKKSLAISFSFLDDEKTLTDVETDDMMKKLVQSFENELGAVIRN